MGGMASLTSQIIGTCQPNYGQHWLEPVKDSKIWCGLLHHSHDFGTGLNFGTSWPVRTVTDDNPRIRGRLFCLSDNFFPPKAVLNLWNCHENSYYHRTWPSPTPSTAPSVRHSTLTRIVLGQKYIKESCSSRISYNQNSYKLIDSIKEL